MPTLAPRVSIAIPVYNGAPWIGETLESALGQTNGDLEVVVVDNASTDETVDVVRSYDDERIRLYVNRENVGFVRNQNRAVAYGRGELVKFLHADDVLLPHCVERMTELFDRHEGLGLVFAPRRIELSDESDPDLRRWRRTYARLERGFSELQAVNDGRRLFTQWMLAGFPGNWIGEPSSVMMRRSCLQATGLFSLKVHIVNDIDMWVRAMLFGDVGFVDEELSVYRAGRGNLTNRLKAEERDWMDLLWILEGLAGETDALDEFPELRPILATQRRRALSALARTALTRPSLAPAKLHDLLGYGAYRTQRWLERAPLLHPPLPVAEPGWSEGSGVNGAQRSGRDLAAQAG